MDDEGLVTMAEAARLKGVSYRTVARHIRRGVLPARWRRGRWCIAPGDPAAWAAARHKAPRKHRRPAPGEGPP